MAKASPRMFLTLLYLSAAVVALIPAAGLSGEENSRTSVMEDCSVPMQLPTFTAGLRAWIDPATGKLRQPTEEERSAHAKRFSVESLLNRSSEGLVVITRPDGSKHVNLEGRFMHALVVKRSEDGTLTARCIDEKPHENDSKSQVAVSEPPLR